MEQPKLRAMVKGRSSSNYPGHIDQAKWSILYLRPGIFHAWEKKLQCGQSSRYSRTHTVSKQIENTLRVCFLVYLDVRGHVIYFIGNSEKDRCPLCS